MATLIVHGTPHQLGHPSPQPSVKPIAARGRGEASPRPAPVRPPALVTPPSPTAIPKPPQDVDPTADAHDEVRPSQERAKCSEERLPLHADHRNTQRSISSLSSAIKKTPKLPKLPNAFSAKWNQQDVEDVDDAEFFEKYLVQSAREKPFQSSARQWLFKGAGLFVALAMPWGPAAAVIGAVLGGLLGFAFSLANDVIKMQKKQNAAKEQMLKIDQLMRWANFHFEASEGQLQLLFKVIVEFQALAAIGALSKSARKQLKKLYAFIDRPDVGFVLWSYLDYFLADWQEMTRAEISLCETVCEVSVECCRILAPWEPPLVVKRMEALLADPAMQQLFSSSKMVKHRQQERALQEVDCIMYADAGVEVHKQIMRGGDLFEPSHRRISSAFAGEASDGSDSEGSPADEETDEGTEIPTEILPFAPEACEEAPLSPPRSPPLPPPLPPPLSPPLPPETFRGEPQDPKRQSSMSAFGPDRARPSGPCGSGMQVSFEPLARSFAGSTVSISVAGSNVGSLAAAAAGRSLSKLHSRSPSNPSTSEAAASSLSRKLSQAAADSSKIAAAASPTAAAAAAALAKPARVKSLRKKQSIVAGPQQLFRSYTDLVNFEPDLKHQTPIAPYEFAFLASKETHDPSQGGWEVSVDNATMKCYRRVASASPVVLVKAYAALQGLPLQVVCHHVRDIPTRLAWDTTFADYRLIEEDMDGCEIIYCSMKAPFPVSHRDFLQWRRTYVDEAEGVVKMLLRSAAHPNVPEKAGVVRAETLISGYMMRRMPDDPGSTNLFILAQTDVKGLIPKWVVNTAASRAPMGWVDSLRRACESYMKKHGTTTPPYRGKKS
eukprot:GHVT01023002.1.p1 GENE.GHVT01023002.1~~GHVT01023002.1.p1  ORF type:complete len:834 (+),score=207.12 GHVT01023002.1:410-2911(+)